MKTKLSTVALAISTLLAGCAVSPGKVQEQVAQKTNTIEVATQNAASQKKQEPALMRIKGNFLGSSAHSINSSKLLPPAYRNVVLNFGERTGSIATVAANITRTTGLAVRVNPDVNFQLARFTPPTQSSATPNPAAAANQSSQTASNASPQPGLTLGQAPSNAPAPVQVAFSAAPMTGQLPLSFVGDLSDYLDSIASALGANWEFANNEIHIFRIVTRTFTLAVSPGGVHYKDEMSGGGNGTSAASGSTQNFGSTNTSGAWANLNPWDSLGDTVKTLIGPGGKFAINQSTGTLVVSDAKEVVDRIEKWVTQQNAILRAQVVIDVREITVQIDDKSNAGLDLNAVYSKLNASTGTADWAFKFVAPSTLTDAAAGQTTFNIVKPNNRWAGSTAAVQALNTFGQVVSDFTDSIVTTNRVPGRKQSVTDQAYLASTTPAVGGGTAGGTGVPGLTPGVVTYGTNLTVVPTVSEDNTVLLQLFDTRSDLLNISSVSTGAGATLQQINTPTLARRKYSQNFSVGQGETLVIVGSNGESWSSSTAYGATGASNTGKRVKTMQVLLVTPRILQGS